MPKQAYLHFGSGDEPRQTVAVESKEMPMWHHRLGLTFTASGYGVKMPSPLMVKWQGRWRRVYICQISNSGTAYIGKPGAWLATVSQDY